MTKIYVDTNVYLDYFEGRTDYMRPLGDFAHEVFQRTLSCEFTIIVSSLLFDELLKYTSKEMIDEIIEELKEKNKVMETYVTAADYSKTKRIVHERKTSFADTAHAVIAKRMNADFIVTRNIKDFLELQDFSKITLPENL